MKLKSYNIAPDTTDIGVLCNAGEHNAATLIFSLPPELRDCDFVNAEFALYDGTEVIDEQLQPDVDSGTLTVSLTQQLTRNCTTKPVPLQVQLVGYVIDSETSEPQVISKSPIMHGTIKPSVNGVLCETDRNPSLVERMYKRLTLLWLRVQDLWAERHEHTNNRTLDRLRCESVENTSGIGGTSTLGEYLCFNGAPLRRASDGAVITDVTQVTRGGKTYARYWLDNGPLSVGSVPSYFDLPVDSIVQTQSTDTGITLNGIELALPAAERMVINSSATNAQLLPNTDYHFGEVEALSVALIDGDPSISNEYYFTFISGSTATVLTLPADICFANELEVEADKKYQISIMDNIALWVAVDWAGDNA